MSKPEDSVDRRQFLRLGGLAGSRRVGFNFAGLRRLAQPG